MKRTPLKRTGRLKPRSVKRAAWQRTQRAPFVLAILTERPWCEIQWGPDCTGRAVDVDEIRLRSAGGSATDPANVQSCCRSCHTAKHLNPSEAERRGFYVRGRGAA